MARINLLPWREELRSERQRQFMISTLMTAVLGMVLVFLIGLVIDQRISHQNSRNQILRAEITRLEARISRIQQIEQTRARLLSRKQVIEELQASRSLTVELMDKMAKSIPVGVTLNTVRQQGMNITFSGFSQSNARVSAYLQSLEQNDLFLFPELRVVRTSERVVNPGEPYEFTISAKLRPRIGAEDEGEYGDADAYDEADDGGEG